MLVKKNYGGGVNKFWRGEAKILPSPYKVTNAPAVGAVIERGVLAYATPDLECTLLRTVEAYADISTTSLKVKKGSLVAVGTRLSDGSNAAAVTAIDTTTSEDYDTLTLSATITGVKAGDVLFEATSGAVTALVSPNVVVGSDKQVTVYDGANVVVDLAYEALVLRGIAAPVPASLLDGGLCLKDNHSIKFINQ